MFHSITAHRLRAWRSWLTGVLAAASLAAMLSPVQASTVDCSQPLDVHLSYTVNNQLAVPVTDVITFNRYAVCTGPGSWWPSSAAAGASTITDPFAKSSSNMPQQGLMLGLATGLPGDAEGQMHVVMMVGNAAAQAAEGIAWGTTFLNTLEDRIVANLMLTMRTDRAQLVDGGAEALAWDAALTELYTFVTGDASGMWFDLPPDPQPGTTTTSDFTVMAWSDGTIVGTGQATLTVDAPAPVPEPGTLALAGVGVLALLRRRTRAA